MDSTWSVREVDPVPVEVKVLCGITCGPGETQLEMDRRIILNRMSLLKERLAEIDKQKSTQRKTADV